MVHLSPDSRLLVSLVKQEEAYSTQLYSLLNASATSLSALAVYASSSPPTISPVLTGVASALSGADEALRSYGEALNDWISQLGTIKSKEEEVANVGRDREILVTRLLKVSQKSKSPPPSLLHTPSDSSSNLSFATLNTKVTVAQSELQACELHLAEAERALEQHRIKAIKQGLKLRCEALVQCGWVWGDMGRRALSMLEELNGHPLSANGHAPDVFKSLPHPNHDHDRDSVLSSLTPSQSASQIGATPHSASSPSHEKPTYRLDIPAPHQLSEQTLGSFMYGSGEPDDGNSSSEDEGPVEVHDNPRFNPAARERSIRTAPSTPTRASPVSYPNSTKARGASSDIGLPTSTQGKYGRDRKSGGFFGSIALLFRTSMNSKSTPSHSGRTWGTRTNHNVRGVKTDIENSSDDGVPRTGRLRKGKARSALDNTGRDGVVFPREGTSQPPSSVVPPARIKDKVSGGKLSRMSIGDRSTNEPAFAPRVRANTLTSSSSGRVLGEGQGKGPRSHGRRASIDGRWGLADPETLSAASSHTSSQKPSSTPVWKISKQTTGNKASSLMSIVEGVSHASQHDDPSSRLEVVRAPGNETTNLPLLIHHPPPLSPTTSRPASPVKVSVAQKRASLPSPPTSTFVRDLAPAAEKKPLRSAMRSPTRDRSTSPSRVASLDNIVAEAGQPSSSMPPLSLPGSASSSLRPLSLTQPEIPATIAESPPQSNVGTTVSQTTAHRQSSTSMNTDDSASVSSYETGHEDLDYEPSAPSPPASPPASEKVETPQQSHLAPSLSLPNGAPGSTISDKHELSSATSTETATGATTTRRKSVRMSSLPPQVSATPPALDDDDEDRSPWGGPRAKTAAHAVEGEGWKTRISAGHVPWDDSSSEDEVYKNARSALNRVERRLEKSQMR